MKSLTDLLNIDFPVIVAPMFLVSNVEMVVAACESGGSAAIPALNYRSVDEMKEAIRKIKSQTSKAFGINLIVNKSNILYQKQLEAICEEKVAYIITSLGSPEETIIKAHKNGILVFCDVTDLNYAKKVEDLGADAIIAVNSEAGGHAGKIKSDELISTLVKNCSVPIISAGGIGTGSGINKMMSLGAAGVSMGSIFIATNESPVSQEYKEACVKNGEKDIVMTSKLSGTPCTVINTPYVQNLGTEQTWLEIFLSKNKRIKKWIKTLTFLRGMKKLQNAATGATYKTVWCAGPSIEHTKEILSISEIFTRLKSEYLAAKHSN